MGPSEWKGESAQEIQKRGNHTGSAGEVVPPPLSYMGAQGAGAQILWVRVYWQDYSYSNMGCLLAKPSGSAPTSLQKVARTEP